jgi:hypothetical protein
MNIEQFTQRNGSTQRDAFAACKMYKGQDRSSGEWNEILKKDFTFNSPNASLYIPIPIEKEIEKTKIEESIIEPEKTTEKVKLVKKSQTKKT